MRLASFGAMPDEQRETKQDNRESEPTQTQRHTEHPAPTRRSYATEDGENPLICRGID